MFRSAQEIGPYTLIKRIGRGGFGEVWLAERRAKFVTTKVAIKLPLEEQVETDAIRNEAGLWEQASGHPNVLPIIEADEYDGQIVSVSEYAPDGSLNEFLEREGALPIKKAVNLAIGILNGLEFLHSKKIIHRDLKPANILLQGETPRLTDFGISRVMKTTHISESMSGTPAYMAPEAFDRKRTAQTDIWSVGVIVFQMLNGTLPFSHANLTEVFAAIIRDEPAPHSESVPGELQQIVSKALSKNPGSRHQTAQEMHRALEDFLITLSHGSFAETLRHGADLPTLPFESKLSAPGRGGSTDEQSSAWTEQAGQSSSPEVRQPRRLGQKFRPSIVAGAILLMLALSAGAYYLFRPTDVNKTGLAASPPTQPEGLLIPYLKGDKFGFRDSNGKMIIEPKYDYVRPFSEGLAVVNIGRDRSKDYAGDGKWGAIDRSGTEVVPIKYDELTDFADGVAITNVGMDWDPDGKFVAFGKFGLIDRFGHELVPPKYDQIGRFSEGLASVEQNNYFGFIDRGGNVVVPPKYSHVGYFSEGVASVETGSRIRGLTKTGSRINTKGGKVGFIDWLGKEVVAPTYGWAGQFSEKLANVAVGAKCGYIGNDGKFAIGEIHPLLVILRRFGCRQGWR